MEKTYVTFDMVKSLSLTFILAMGSPTWYACRYDKVSKKLLKLMSNNSTIPVVSYCEWHSMNANSSV